MKAELIPRIPEHVPGLRSGREVLHTQRINHSFILSSDFIVAGYPLASDRVESSADRVSTIRQL
jgi:hypothetical protein